MTDSQARSRDYARRTWRLSTGLLLTGWLLLAGGPAWLTPAGATEARLIALGGVGDYIEDDSNVRRWYGSLLDYADLWSLDSGYFGVNGYPRHDRARVSGPAVSAHIQFDQAGEWGTVGLFWDSRDHPGNPGRLAGDSVLSGVRQLMYGRRLGAVQTVFGVAMTNADTESGGGAQPTVSGEVAQTDLSLGLRFDAAENLYLDLAGEVRRFRHVANTSGGGGDWASDDRTTWSNIGLRGRAVLELGERTALVPVLEYLGEERAEPSSLPYLTQDLDGHLWRAGCGLNFLPDLDSLVFIFAEYLTSKVDLDREVHAPTPVTRYHHTQNWQAFNFRVGLEKRFQSWLTLRAATGYRFVDDEIQDWAIDPAVSNPAMTSESRRIPLSIGIAGHLGRWDLNLAVTNDQPLPSPLTLPTSFYFDPGGVTWLAVTLASGFWE